MGNILDINTRTNQNGGSPNSPTIIETKQTLDFCEDFVKNTNPTFIFKVSQLSGRLTYEQALSEFEEANVIKPEMHLGQMKLFFCELLFLTKYIADANKVLYVGAAKGYHISKLADLFPNVIFDLWDPGQFDLFPRDNMRIYNKFFTTDTAKIYAQSDDKILFMCDIRNLSIAQKIKNLDGIAADEIVDNDMRLQAEWIKIINPIYAYLKFRLPWFTDYSKYLSGTIYLQPYAPTGTEARLMTNNYVDYVMYNNKEYDEKMAFFNFRIRFNTSYPRWDKICHQYKLKNCWDTAYCLYVTDYYLRKIHGIRSDEKTGQLYMEIVNFHIQKYGKKYDILFEKTKN